MEAKQAAGTGPAADGCFLQAPRKSEGHATTRQPSDDGLALRAILLAREPALSCLHMPAAEGATPQPEPAEAEDPRPGHDRPPQAPGGNSRHPASRARRAGGSPCRLLRPENVTGRDRPATNRPRCAEGRVVQGGDSRLPCGRISSPPPLFCLGNPRRSAGAPLRRRGPPRVCRFRNGADPRPRGFAARRSPAGGVNPEIPCCDAAAPAPTCRPGRAGKGPETAAVRFRPGAQPSE